MSHILQGPGRAGLILIFLGITVPLFLLLFTSNYQPGAGLFSNILHLELVVKGVQIKALGWTRIAIPYRFPLAACIFLIFVGIRILEQARGDRPDGPEHKA